MRFFQNIISEFTLWQLMPEDEIFSFYQEMFRLVSGKPFLLYYLYDPDPEPHLRQICRERADSEGNPLWYPLMMQYLAASPYGKKYGCSTFEDLLSCLKRRQELELRLIREILKDRAVVLPAKRYTNGGAGIFYTAAISHLSNRSLCVPVRARVKTSTSSSIR